MLHYVHRLVANCVCLLFGAEQVAYTGISELFHRKQLPAAAKNDTMRVVRMNQNSKVAAEQLKKELKLA